MTKTEEELIAAVRNEYLRDRALSFDDLMVDLGGDCESPIERVLLAALAAFGRPSVYFRWGFEPDKLMLPGAHDGVYIHVQQEIGPYRADFAVVAVNNGEYECIVVECDGHDFHERTKEQAARDKKRDRYFAGLGYAVLRFTGSEIWADASACAGEILKRTNPREMREMMQRSAERV